MLICITMSVSIMIHLEHNYKVKIFIVQKKKNKILVYNS